MDRRDLYFTDDIRKNLCEIRGKIASTDSWQIELVDAEKLSRLTRDWERRVSVGTILRGSGSSGYSKPISYTRSRS